MLFHEKDLAEELMEMIKLAHDRNYKEILHLFAIKSAEVSDADRVCLIILNLKKQLIIKAGFPSGAHPVNQIIIPEFGEHFLRQVMEYRKYVWINNPAADPQTSYMRELAKFRNITSILFMPLYNRNEPLGMLVFDFIDGKRISKENIRRMVNVADLVAIIMATEYEKRKREKDLQHYERMIALGENAARAAHSIRNPLTAIGGFSKKIERLLEKAGDLISEKYPDTAKDDNLKKIFGKLKEYHQIISSDERKIERILKEVLVFSRLPQINTALGNLNECLQEEITRFMSVFNRKIQCKFDLGKTLNYVRVPFDKEKLAFCLQDLLRNAKEAEADCITVRTRLKAEKKKVYIFLQNNGAKIEPMIKSEIFLPFVTAKTDGTGLGLAIVRSIIEAHEGSIELENHPHLTTFKITLPFER